MAQGRTIFLTSFEPFGGSNVNPSILACRWLKGREYNGFKIIGKETPQRFHEIRGIIDGYIWEKNPPPLFVQVNPEGPR